jgi:hypothetical protein|tara:strand:- start:256 stop:906 length:651 start_codon:yes stop_codon:yes gene_type:complete
MKKLLYIFLTVLIVGCSGENGDNNNTSNNSNNVDYFFEVEFGGVINRVEGNTAEAILNDWIYFNKCSGTTAGVLFSISDITRDTFISGQNMSINMGFENAQLGANNGNLGLFPINAEFYIEQYLNSLGVTANTQFVENKPMSFLDGYYELGKISNINLTDLGTPSTVNSATGNIIYGETIKGTYEGILYFLSSPPAPGANYDIAVPIRVAFNAVRL